MINNIVKELCAVSLLSCIFVMFYFSLIAYGQGGIPEKYNQNMRIKNEMAFETTYLLYNHGYVTPITNQYYKLTKITLVIGIIIYAIFLPCLLIGIVQIIKEFGFESGLSNYIWKELFWPMKSDVSFTLFAKLYFIFLFIFNILLFVININFVSEKSYIILILITYIIIGFTSLYAIKFIKNCKQSTSDVVCL